MHSALYEGAVAHRRRAPVKHRFRYNLAMAWLDLDELPDLVGPGGPLFKRLFGASAFCREDHLFNREMGLADEVRRLVAAEAGEAAAGPIRVLTQLRWFGYYFSPLNLFYLYDAAGKRVEQVLAEVNNTPWGERHSYVLSDQNRVAGRSRLSFRHPKTFHVSPFMGMAADYVWRLDEPGEWLKVSLAHFEGGTPLFDASMVMQQRPLTRARLRAISFTRPVMTAQITAAIYYEAMKLWWKECPYYPHPRTLTQ